ncbi:MAG: OmpH family outer membrane protein [Elusimicrobiota bacterium]|nr:OmpH family outer membrane protein [Elusimicrobiota bacterium]
MVKSGKKGAIALTALKFICLCFLCSGLVRAEMISTQKVAFVDIEGIYSRFRMKELAEKEVDIRREKYLSDITAMDAKIRQLETSMALEEENPVSVSTMSAAASELAVSTTSATGVEISTATVKTDTRGEDIKALREQKELLSVEARENLKNIKSEYMSQIMGRIYDAVAEAAEEGGYDLVIDKNNAVYGIPATDLTEMVLEKLK